MENMDREKDEIVTVRDDDKTAALTWLRGVLASTLEVSSPVSMDEERNPSADMPLARLAHGGVGSGP